MSSKETSKAPLPSGTASTTTAEALRQHLAKLFPIRPRKSKYTGPERPFQIDDRTDADPWRWEVSVGVLDAAPPSLILLLHSIPNDAALSAFAGGLGARVIPKEEHSSYVIHLRPDDTQTVRQLARMIRAVKTTRWQWLSKRAADSLDQLISHLARLSPP
jgi:hypothetical protein